MTYHDDVCDILFRVVCVEFLPVVRASLGRGDTKLLLLFVDVVEDIYFLK